MTPLDAGRGDAVSPLESARGDTRVASGVTFGASRGDTAVSPEPKRTLNEPTEGTETTDGAAAPVAAGDLPADETSKPDPLGPGSKLYKRLARVVPNHEQREQLEAAFVEHGPEHMESIIRDWLINGYRKRNVKGMINVMAVGWRQRGSDDRGILAKGRPVSQAEADAIHEAVAEGMAAVDEQLAARAAKTPPADGGFWAIALGELSRQMTRPTFNTWLKDTKGALDGDTLVVTVPSVYCRDWLDKRLRPTVEGVVQELAGRPVACEFVVADGASVVGSEAA